MNVAMLHFPRGPGAGGAGSLIEVEARPGITTIGRQGRLDLVTIAAFLASKLALPHWPAPAGSSST